MFPQSIVGHMSDDKKQSTCPAIPGDAGIYKKTRGGSGGKVTSTRSFAKILKTAGK